MAIVDGYVRFGHLCFPLLAGSPRVIAELQPLGFTPGPAPTPTTQHAGRAHHDTPSLIIEAHDRGYRTLVVEAGETTDAARARGPVPRVFHGAPVPSGGHFATASAAVHTALSIMTERLVRAEPESTHLHAGAVELDGLGVVIPAVSGSGKTTLVGEAGGHGKVLTDELVGIRRNREIIHAAKRPLSIKPDGFARAQRRYPHCDPPHPDEFVWHLALETIGLTHLDQIRPGVVVIPRRRPGPAEVEPVEPAAVLLELFGHGYDLDVDPARSFADLAWLAQVSEGLRVSYEEADDAVAALRTHLGPGRAAPTQRFTRIDDGQNDNFGVAIDDTEVWWNPTTRQVRWIKAPGR